MESCSPRIDAPGFSGAYRKPIAFIASTITSDPNLSFPAEDDISDTRYISCMLTCAMTFLNLRDVPRRSRIRFQLVKSYDVSIALSNASGEKWISPSDFGP